MGNQRDSDNFYFTVFMLGLVALLVAGLVAEAYIDAAYPSVECTEARHGH